MTIRKTRVFYLAISPTKIKKKKRDRKLMVYYLNSRRKRRKKINSLLFQLTIDILDQTNKELTLSIEKTITRVEINGPNKDIHLLLLTIKV